MQRTRLTDDPERPGLLERVRLYFRFTVLVARLPVTVAQHGPVSFELRMVLAETQEIHRRLGHEYDAEWAQRYRDHIERGTD